MISETLESYLPFHLLSSFSLFFGTATNCNLFRLVKHYSNSPGIIGGRALKREWQEYYFRGYKRISNLVLAIPLS